MVFSVLADDENGTKSERGRGDISQWSRACQTLFCFISGSTCTIVLETLITKYVRVERQQNRKRSYIATCESERKKQSSNCIGYLCDQT